MNDIKKKESNVGTFLLYKYYLYHFFNIFTTIKYFVNNCIFVLKQFIKKNFQIEELYFFKI